MLPVFGDLEMKFGLEWESFVTDAKGVISLIPKTIPHDDCGWLVEARGDPAYTPEKAVGLLLAEKYKIQQLLAKAGLALYSVDFLKLPREFKLSARREFTKGVVRFQNLYGKVPSSLDHAGVHISFTDPIEISYVKNELPIKETVNRLWDFPTVFKKLDKAFAEEIKKARRVPGFYEIKYDGRVEYRSLPSSVDLWKIVDVLNTIMK